MPSPPFRVFFDTSVYIAGLLSPGGAAGELMRLAEAGIVRMVVSEQVIVESDRVLDAKFPTLVEDSRELWLSIAPDMTGKPSSSAVKPFARKLPDADASILCSASRADVLAFVTWNTRDFMKKGVASLVDFPVVVPADCLKLVREWLEPYLPA